MRVTICVENVLGVVRCESQYLVDLRVTRVFKVRVISCYSRVTRQDCTVLYELRGGVRVMVYEASILTSGEVMNNELRVTRVLKVRVMGLCVSSVETRVRSV